MDYIKIMIPCWLLLGIFSAGAQISNTGEMTVLPGTVVSTVEDFDNSSNGTVNNNGQLYLYGNLANEGGFTYRTDGNTGKVLFQGSARQEITGDSPINFYDVSFDNVSSGAPFSLGATINLAHTADFIQGVVQSRDLGGNFIFERSAGYTNASDQSHIDGAVQKIGNQAFTFPIGNKGFLRESTVLKPKDPDARLVSRYELENSHAMYPHNAVLGIIGFIDDSEYWILEKAQGALDVALTLGLDNATTPMELIGAEPSEVHIVRWDEVLGVWADEGGRRDISAGNITTEPLSAYGIFTLALVSTDDTDSDGDGVPDFVENNALPPTDPNDPTDFIDTDGDGVPDYVENNTVPATDPNDINDFLDRDGDGFPDYIEDQGVDSDGDGVPDYIELTDDPATDPNDPEDFTDSDGDGVPDYAELNDDPITDPNDADDFGDADGDGVPDYVETHGNPDNDPSDPNDPNDFDDSDGDGVPDYIEINGEPATDPNDATDFIDGDADGIPDYIEGSYTATDIFIENDLVSKSLPSGFFEIVNIGLFPDNRVEIFNRNGVKVFEIEGYDNNSRVFRGISNGRATIQQDGGLPTGVYFYIVQYVQEGNGRTRSGYLYINE